jgi:hypothetical protein
VQDALRSGQHREAVGVGPEVTGGRIGRTEPPADGDDEGGHRQGGQPEQDEQSEDTT